MNQSLPTFVLERCETTGFCVQSCPTECLALVQDAPVVIEPNRCLSCGVCEAVCPTHAVLLPPIVAPEWPPEELA